jgi:hypothetical protein
VHLVAPDVTDPVAPGLPDPDTPHSRQVPVPLGTGPGPTRAAGRGPAPSLAAAAAALAERLGCERGGGDEGGIWGRPNLGPGARVRVRVSLRDNRIGDAGARVLALALADLARRAAAGRGPVRGPARLDLGLNRIGPAGARALGDALAVTDALEELSLADNPVFLSAHARTRTHNHTRAHTRTRTPHNTLVTHTSPSTYPYIRSRPFPHYQCAGD